MRKRIALIIVLAIIIAIGAIIIYILRPTKEASAPIEAVPLQINPTQTSNASAGSNVQMEPTDTQNSIIAGTEQETADTTRDAIFFTIDQENSTVSFTLNEVLRGVPTTVVGNTNQVAGEIAVDVGAPVKTMVGTILVNARTLVTDNNFRNRAIQNEILKTGDYEYITFTPKMISGIPENPQIGEEMSLQITGNLTIRDISQEINFTATVTVTSETSMMGYASAVVNRADFNLVIPEVPHVANVDEQVLLEIHFFAEAK
jgi:polyisoprenoid-binding protein YceI